MNEQILKFYKYAPVKKPQYAGKFCSTPYRAIQVDNDGDVQLCLCTLHMPHSIGNIFQNSLQEIWKNAQATEVRDSVFAGDFTYCNWACNALHNLSSTPAIEPSVPDFPQEISVDLDLSCNLKCPSCREEIIIEKSSYRIEQQIKLFREIYQWAVDHPAFPINLNPSSRGEIFASHSGLEFLQLLRNYPHNNLKLKFTTNGTLIRKNWELIQTLKNTITQWNVSIDAATKETYAQIRGGNWEELVAGLELIKELRPKGFFINFCIQKNNYHEIEMAADFANQYGAVIQYQKLDNWGHWDAQWWHDNNVFDRQKESFNQTLDSLQLVRAKYPKQATFSGQIMKHLNKIS